MKQNIKVTLNDNSAINLISMIKIKDEFQLIFDKTNQIKSGSILVLETGTSKKNYVNNETLALVKETTYNSDHTIAYIELNPGNIHLFNKDHLKNISIWGHIN